jgi:hypothetical protein
VVDNTPVLLRSDLPQIESTITTARKKEESPQQPKEGYVRIPSKAGEKKVVSELHGLIDTQLLGSGFHRRYYSEVRL